MVDMALDSTPRPLPSGGQKFGAEVLGTFVLVFFGVGAALASGGDITTTGLAFGLTVLVMAYGLGRISGGHFNPAVTAGAAVGGRLAWSQVPLYVGAQLLGAVAGSAVLWSVWQGFPGFSSQGDFGQNSFGDQSQYGLAWWAALLVEAVATFVFLLVILAVTDERNEHPGLAPLAIGLTLAMIHFALIPLTGTSVNPARSIGPALFAGTDAIQQLWLFILAPLLGGLAAGLVYPLVFGRHGEPVPGSGFRFSWRRPPGAVPGYGAPDAYQQQWNQQYPPYGQQPANPANPASRASRPGRRNPRTLAAAAVPDRSAAGLLARSPVRLPASTPGRSLRAQPAQPPAQQPGQQQPWQQSVARERRGRPDPGPPAALIGAGHPASPRGHRGQHGTLGAAGHRALLDQAGALGVRARARPGPRRGVSHRVLGDAAGRGTCRPGR